MVYVLRDYTQQQVTMVSCQGVVGLKKKMIKKDKKKMIKKKDS